MNTGSLVEGLKPWYAKQVLSGVTGSPVMVTLEYVALPAVHSPGLEAAVVNIFSLSGATRLTPADHKERERERERDGCKGEARLRLQKWWKLYVPCERNSVCYEREREQYTVAKTTGIHRNCTEWLRVCDICSQVALLTLNLGVSCARASSHDRYSKASQDGCELHDVQEWRRLMILQAAFVLVVRRCSVMRSDQKRENSTQKFWGEHRNLGPGPPPWACPARSNV